MASSAGTPEKEMGRETPRYINCHMYRRRVEGTVQLTLCRFRPVLVSSLHLHHQPTERARTISSQPTRTIDT